MSYSQGPRRDLPAIVAAQISITAGVLRRARERGGWTQRAVADATGVSLSTIQYIERAKQVPALDTLLILAEFYGLVYDLRRPAPKNWTEEVAWDE